MHVCVVVMWMLAAFDPARNSGMVPSMVHNLTFHDMHCHRTLSFQASMHKAGALIEFPVPLRMGSTVV